MALNKNTVKQAQCAIDDIRYQLDNYSKIIRLMNKNTFAYHVYNYQSKVNSPIMAMCFIFNDHFDVNIIDFKEVVALMKESDEYLSDRSSDTKKYPKVPIFFYKYMKGFWERALSKLQEKWKPDPLDLAVLTVEYQREQNYSVYWSVNLMKLFFGASKQKETLKDLVSDAQKILDDGDSIKRPQDFHWLLGISMGGYLNALRLKEDVEWQLRSQYSFLYQKHKNSADNKIKKSVKDAVNNVSKPITFTPNEILILKYKNEADYIKKSTQKIIKNL